MKALTGMQRLTALARRQGALRARDLAARGIPYVYLRRLCDRGVLLRCGRGLYMLADSDVTEHHSLVEACKRVPRGVVCLLSALRFHGMTTESPHEVWMAVDRSAHRPRVDAPPLHVVRFSGPALTDGVGKHRIEGVTVLVYSAAKTVADCFKFRHKIGLDVALEALRDYQRYKLGTVDELWRHARTCRVARVMRPYMEAIIA